MIDFRNSPVRVEMLKQVTVVFLDSLPAGKRPHRCNLGRICGKERHDSVSIVVVECFIKFQNGGFNLLNERGVRRKSLKRVSDGRGSCVLLAEH